VHTLTSHFLKIHVNIIHTSTPGSPQWSLSLRFSHQNPVHASPLNPYALHAPPISSFSILSPEQYSARSTDRFPSFGKEKTSCRCRTAQNSRSTNPQPGHYTEVNGGFPEIISRFHEAVKRFSNFFQSNSFRKKFTSFSLLAYTRHSLPMNK